LGYDAPSNIGILVLALLYGKGDFSETLCIAVNCGEDTDCTAATAGSLLGIIHGTRGIPDKWIAPIGRGIKTISLNLGDLGHFGSFVPQTVDNLTTRTEKIALKVLEKYARNNVSIVENEKSAIVAIANDLKADTSTFSLSNGGLTSTYRYPFYEIKVAYEGGVFVEQGKEKLVKVTIIPKYRVSAVLNLHWYLPDGMLTVPTHDKQVVVAPNQQQIIQTAINVNFLTKSTTRGALEISIDGRPSVMLVPLIFISAAMAT